MPFKGLLGLGGRFEGLIVLLRPANHQRELFRFHDNKCPAAIGIGQWERFAALSL